MRPSTAHEQRADGMIARGFRYVDASEDPGRLAAYLAAATLQLKQHKRASYEMLDLRPGSRVLEVGCGTGEDARILASRVAPDGHVVGIDASVLLIEQALARAASTGLPLEFIVADAHNTGLADDSFDAARVERCLQHVERPEAVITEMRRVVRTGGSVVACEPDWDTLVVDACDRPLTRFIAQTFSDRHLAHGTIGRQLPALMLSAGMHDLTIRPMTLVTRSFAVANPERAVTIAPPAGGGAETSG